LVANCFAAAFGWAGQRALDPQWQLRIAELIDVPGKLFNPEEVSKFARSCFLERIGTC
jgi:hypothetical protein